MTGLVRQIKHIRLSARLPREGEVQKLSEDTNETHSAPFEVDVQVMLQIESRTEKVADFRKIHQPSPDIMSKNL